MSRTLLASADDLEIALGVTVKDWKALDLRNNPKCEQDWQKAIDIVENRLVKRYFEPCKFLIDEERRNSKDKANFRFGFAIMAINCLLVETLQSFIMGKTTTKDQSAELSKEFLTSTDSFKSVFTIDIAQIYYDDVRCGLLHIGETHKLSRIIATGPIVSKYDGGIVINRTKFNEALRKEFDRFITDLRSGVPSQRRSEFRRRIKKKMNFICRIMTE